MPDVFGTVESEFAVEDFILPATEIEVTFNGADLTPYLLSYQAQGSRGQPVSGSIVLKDRDGYVARILSQFRRSTGNYHSHNMTDDRVLVLTVTQGSKSTDYPTLIPGDPSWDNDATLTLSFSDLTPLIDIDNQSTDNIVHDEGDDGTAYDAIAALAALTDYPITPEFTDYDINTFRFNQSNIFSGLDELQAVKQAFRKWEGSSLKLKPLPVTPTVTGELIDRQHIPEGGATVSEDVSNLRTYFKYFKNKAQDSALAEKKSCTGRLGEESPCVGRVVELIFSRPAHYARILTTQTHGSIGAGVFFDDAGEPLNETPATIYNNLMHEAVRWLGTYTPDFGDDAYVPSWTAWAIGGSSADPEQELFNVSKTVSAAAAIYGARPEYKDMASELLLHEEDAELMLDAIEKEAIWGINQISINTPFLLSEREGDYISVTHYKHGLDEETCLLNGWTHSYSFDSGWSNTYDLRFSI